jgi:glycosyltransferase involved in cell wall biosynthesis
MSETIQALEADANKIFVNRPAIKPGYFQRQKQYHNNTDLTILSIGRLTFQKGYMVGLLALKEVVKSNPSVSWKIVGDGPSKEELIFYINDLQLQDHVQLLGAKTTSEILELYNTADIFFLPSVYEGIANVVLEAMSMELPVVSSDCSGMKEVIQHDVNGLLASNYDHGQMADCLRKLCADYNKRKTLGLNARKTIVENFDIEKQLDVFEYNYQRLLETR